MRRRDNGKDPDRECRCSDESNLRKSTRESLNDSRRDPDFGMRAAFSRAFWVGIVCRTGAWLIGTGTGLDGRSGKHDSRVITALTNALERVHVLAPFLRKKILKNFRLLCPYLSSFLYHLNLIN